jgi:hypothetical protein
MHGRVSCLGLTIIGAALLSGCGGSTDTANQQAQYPMYNNPQQQAGNPTYNAAGQQQPMQQAQPGYGQQPMQQQPVQQQPVQQQPVQQQPVQQQPQPAAPAAVQEVDASMAAPVQPLLTQMVKSQVPPGAKPLGNLIVANFPAGGKLQKQVQLTLNKCYTVVGAGAPGVGEVNLSLVPNLPLATALAVDSTQGPQATLGPNPNCYKQILFSAPMNLVIDVPAGQGLVAVQVYEK